MFIALFTLYAFCVIASSQARPDTGKDTAVQTSVTRIPSAPYTKQCDSWVPSVNTTNIAGVNTTISSKLRLLVILIRRLCGQALEHGF